MQIFARFKRTCGLILSILREPEVNYIATADWIVTKILININDKKISTFIKAGESIHWKLVKARIRIYSFVSAIIARRPASEFLAALGMVKATSWDGWTDRYEKWAMFYKTQVYKQEGNSCTWQPGDGTRTHASQARLSPHDPAHSTLHGPFLTAGRPSLRISLLVVHSPKITEIVEKSAFPLDYPRGPLWRLEERQGSSTSRNAIVYRRVFAPLDRSCIVQEWFDFSALFSISLHFNADCTRHQVSRWYPSDVSLARSLSPVDFYLRRATNPMRNARLNTVKRREGREEGGRTKFSHVRSRGWSKTARDRPGVLSPRTFGSNIRCWKHLFRSFGSRTDHSKLLRNWRIRDGMCAICANMCFRRCASNETEMLTPSPIQPERESVCDLQSMLSVMIRLKHRNIEFILQ